MKKKTLKFTQNENSISILFNLRPPVKKVDKVRHELTLGKLIYRQKSKTIKFNHKKTENQNKSKFNQKKNQEKGKDNKFEYY